MKEKKVTQNHFFFKLLFLVVLSIAIVAVVYELVELGHKRITTAAPTTQITTEPQATQCISKLYLIDLNIVSKLKDGEYDAKVLDGFIKATGSNELRKTLYQIKEAAVAPDAIYSALQKIKSDNQDLPVAENLLIRMLSKIMVIKKIGQPNNVSELLLAIKNAVNNGNYENALNLMQKLPTPEQEQAATLTGYLQQEINKEKLIEQIYNLVISEKYKNNFNMECKND